MNQIKNKKNGSFLYFFLFIFIIQPGVKDLMAQENKKSSKSHLPPKYAIGLLYENGTVFQTNTFVKGINKEMEPIKNYQAFSGRIIFQTTGEKYWQQIFGFPTWGFGLHISDFYNPEEMGVPIALYVFLNAPFHSWNNLSFNYEIDFGLTANWKKFNPVSNQYNVAIGAGETVYIHVGAGLYYKFLKCWEAGAGIGLTHFSNGALKKPNFGLNTFSPRIEIKYNVSNQAKLKKQIIPAFHQFNSLDITFFAGLKNVIYDSLKVNIKTRYKGVYFPVFGLSSTFSRQLTYKSKVGIGISFSYDGSVNARVSVEKGKLDIIDLPMMEQYRISIFPSYELTMGQFSLLLQPGFYIFRKQFPKQVPISYQRIGLKYTFAKNITAGISLRAYKFHISDFIEWRIGYQINWNKN